MKQKDSQRILQAHYRNPASQRSNQSFVKELAKSTLTRGKESTGIQHCIKVTAGEVVNLRSVLLINFCGGG
tara:strand:- start:2255 stop:2467 length:213 start_codon:yes stop_codon:yes gene_type:complete